MHEFESFRISCRTGNPGPNTAPDSGAAHFAESADQSH
ncbi:hypothetical protein SLNWT_5494 [Streptomyces albus]|uniref:Uncharacterized protein n=1 Tax=Streptomyces albus (strain ATCC 21838 / DSM 41398 / FERM P-419 / JCM 4703 / NBRC 107858) TaxID=1081613 RepID=A0A0B5F2S6_STRA4|nr:hypothetical protein SLNWT_5494 [Streptomyces albus]AOU80173.1 hypothetical protein SLNHY_5482 [Streptomyces albus]AYN35887.1 hypothetical protein DUI70_5394 [Streptomyces albus]